MTLAQQNPYTSYQKPVREWNLEFPMRPTHYLLGVFALSAAVSFSQSKETTHADHMEHHFDAKESAKSFDDPARDAWQMPDRVIAALNLKRGQIVADIGAGTGYFSVRLAKSEAAPKVYAADIEPSMVSYVRERAAKEGLSNVIAVQAAADQPNLPEPVDLVLIVDTYHHIGDREPYFRRLAKSLRPGGQVAIIDFRPDSPDGPPKEFRFPPEKFTSEMGKAGYTLAAQHDFLPRQQFLVFELAGRASMASQATIRCALTTGALTTLRRRMPMPPKMTKAVEPSVAGSGVASGAASKSTLPVIPFFRSI